MELLIGRESADKIIETGRLILRPWSESDAESLFRYACDPDVDRDSCLAQCPGWWNEELSR